jgi:hypothetical protein
MHLMIFWDLILHDPSNLLYGMDLMRSPVRAASSIGKVKQGSCRASEHQEMSVALCKGTDAISRTGTQLYNRSIVHARICALLVPATDGSDAVLCPCSVIMHLLVNCDFDVTALNGFLHAFSAMRYCTGVASIIDASFCSCVWSGSQNATPRAPGATLSFLLYSSARIAFRCCQPWTISSARTK